MEYPGSKTDWNVFPLPEFDHAEVRDPGNIGMELMVQARDNGRLVDHFRVAVGGDADSGDQPVKGLPPQQPEQLPPPLPVLAERHIHSSKCHHFRLERRVQDAGGEERGGAERGWDDGPQRRRPQCHPGY